MNNVEWTLVIFITAVVVIISILVFLKVLDEVEQFDENATFVMLNSNEGTSFSHVRTVAVIIGIAIAVFSLLYFKFFGDKQNE